MERIILKKEPRIPGLHPCVSRNENKNIRFSGNWILANAYAVGMQMRIDNAVTIAAIKNDNEIEETISSLANTKFHI